MKTLATFNKFTDAALWLALQGFRDFGNQPEARIYINDGTHKFLKVVPYRGQWEIQEPEV